MDKGKRPADSPFDALDAAAAETDAAVPPKFDAEMHRAAVGIKRRRLVLKVMCPGEQGGPDDTPTGRVYIPKRCGRENRNGYCHSCLPMLQRYIKPQQWASYTESVRSLVTIRDDEFYATVKKEADDIYLQLRAAQKAFAAKTDQRFKNRAILVKTVEDLNWNVDKNRTLWLEAEERLKQAMQVRSSLTVTEVPVVFGMLEAPPTSTLEAPPTSTTNSKDSSSV